MKLTKSNLTQIIKEELGNYIEEEGVGREPAAVALLEDALKTVLPIIERAYTSLVDDEAKAEFEDYLLKNITLYVNEWREAREGGQSKGKPASHPLGKERQHWPWPAADPTSTGPWEE